MELSRQEYWSGCHFLLQGIFLTQGLNLYLLYLSQILHHLSHQGSPYSAILIPLWEKERDKKTHLMTPPPRLN